jgi:hypothetical protein
MRYTIAAVGLMIALAFGPAAFAGKDWGDAANGNGYYHVSNDSPVTENLRRNLARTAGVLISRPSVCLPKSRS